MRRLAAYIDGFSLYHGMLAKGLRRHLWLDLHGLMAQFARDDEVLVLANYFTSRVRKPEGSRIRQAVYLDALRAHGDLTIVEGTVEHRPNRCPECEHRWDRPKEKQSDVNLAATLILDALDDRYDAALLVCADADLVPAVQIARERFGKSIILVSPPRRQSLELAAAADASLHFQPRWFGLSQLPDPVDDGVRMLRKPKEWA